LDWAVGTYLSEVKNNDVLPLRCIDRFPWWWPLLAIVLMGLLAVGAKFDYENLNSVKQDPRSEGFCS
jgi:hypothetical protein